jgi:hypothetical protein
MKSERDGINPAAEPSGTGCVECLALGGWWFHLRRCAECGHIGCCDSSPNQHASKHYAATGHPIITSFEPGERWFYDYPTRQFVTGPKLCALTRIRWINRRPDRRERCRQIGKRCFTNRMPRNPYLGAVKLGVRGAHSRQARVIRSIEIGLKRSERFVP